MNVQVLVTDGDEVEEDKAEEEGEKEGASKAVKKHRGVGKTTAVAGEHKPGGRGKAAPPSKTTHAPGAAPGCDKLQLGQTSKPETLPPIVPKPQKLVCM